MAQRIYMNDDWGFTETFSEKLLDWEYDGKDLRRVRLPHTCKETPLHYFDEQIYQMVSGYRRVFRAPEEWKEKRVLLTIDGAAHESEIFLNGKKIGEHHCGYTAFTVELTGWLQYGEDNILAVRVDSREKSNIPPFGFVIDYMTYGGIYREVYLDIVDQNYLADVFVMAGCGEIETEETGSRADLTSEITVNSSTEDLILRQSIRKKGASGSAWHFLGERTLVDSVSRSTGSEKGSENAVRNVPDRSDHRVRMEFILAKVLLWDTQHPHLYELKTELLQDGKILDEKNVTFGFRRAEFRADGFYLNERKVKIRGLNRHQSFPYVGYAMPESMQRRDADILKKELGVNAVRTSHYPQSHYFLDQCDENGLLVFTEMPGWQYIGDENWKQQAIENVREMVRQYRNHTSIILWGVRINESGDDDRFYERTNAAAHALDPSRATGGVRAHKKSSLLEDVYTYNDFVHDGKKRGCDKKAVVTSDVQKPYLISEYNGHMFPTKSYDCEEHQTEHAIRHANVLDAVAAEKEIAGSFGWCMFDYNTHRDFGSGDRVCYHGVMDMFRNPKPAAAVYACEQEEVPVLSVSSSMDIGEHPGCNRGNSYIFSNADSVRMYKNDRFIKEYSKKDSVYKYLKHGPMFIDDYIGDAMTENENMPSEQAEEVKKILNAVARYGVQNLPKSVYPAMIKLIAVYRMRPDDVVSLYTRYVGDWGGESTSYRFEAVKDGMVVKTVTKEPVTSVFLQAEADHDILIEKNSYDVAAVRIRAVDEYGNTLPFFNEPVTFSIQGPVSLIGPETIALQGGMGGTYIRTTGEKGEAVLRAGALQTKEAVLRFLIR